MQLLGRLTNLINTIDCQLPPMAQSSEEKNQDSAGVGCRTCDNYINGGFVPPKDGKYLDVISPHDGTPIGKVALSTADDVAVAVQHASKAFKEWSGLTVKQRVQPLFKLKQLIQDNEEILAKIIMLEHGKNKAEALGSIRKGNETVEYACSVPTLIPGKILEVSSGVTCHEVRLPHGVVASIVPFNFPIMVPLWTLPIALACGNCVLLKPSEKVPLTLNFFCNLMGQAGFPPGVFQVLNGQAACVNALVDAPQIRAVSFVGSTRVARLVYERCKQARPMPKRCLCLGGAKNHLVAAPDCNVQMTASDVVNSFCGCSGQRCMAASVLLVVGAQQNLLDTILERARALRPGAEARNLGPVIDKDALTRMERIISEAEASGRAKILLDGRDWKQKYEECKKGFWLGPTVILYDKPGERGMTEEIFGPVLSVYVCKNKEEAIEIENGCEYGNAACVYTSTGATAEWFSKRFTSGMVGVNIGVPVPREPFAFGGTGESKFGDMDITGDGGIEFWTFRKKITTKWTPPREQSWMS